MSPRTIRCILAALALCVALSSVAVGVTAPGPVTVEQHGSGLALQDGSTTFLWGEDTYALSVRIDGSPTVSSAVVCADVYGTDEDGDDGVLQSFGCETVSIPDEGTRTVTFTQGEWPENLAGDATILVTVDNAHEADSDPLRESFSIPIHVFSPEGDLDGDGLTNEQEIGLGTHPESADTDGDGLNDGLEVMLGTNPRDSSTLYKLALGGFGVLATIVFAIVVFTNRLLDRSSKEPDDAALTADGAAEAAATAEQTPTVEEPPIRDEELVRRLLRDNGGRLKQSQVVDATEWSKSKVSRLLASMEDDGDITRIRLGRENLVCLRGHEPPDVRPSWDQ
ncbi:DUF7343 domain-containing protein [Haloferacaceae archaeon DSL9]